MLALITFAFFSFLCTRSHTSPSPSPLCPLSLSLSGPGDQGYFWAWFTWFATYLRGMAQANSVSTCTHARKRK